MAKKITIKWDRSREDYFADVIDENKNQDQLYGSISAIMASARRLGYTGYTLDRSARERQNFDKRM